MSVRLRAEESVASQASSTTEKVPLFSEPARTGCESRPFPHWLCGPGQVTPPLCASTASFLKQGQLGDAKLVMR